MFYSEINALFLVEKLISIAILFQTIELLQLRHTVAKNGIWTWSVLRKEFEIFPISIQPILNSILDHPNFIYLLLLRLACAVAALFLSHPVFIFILLLSTVLIALRWRGTFNGGSDFMTLIVLMSLFVSMIFENQSQIRAGCLWYMTIQACTSYFISGLIKLKKKNWRSGKALEGFLNSSIYAPAPVFKKITKYSFFLLAASWLVIVFECTFPFALIDPTYCLAWIGLAILFHIANSYIFGLNRFLFAWSATYPALYYCSQYF